MKFKKQKAQFDFHLMISRSQSQIDFVFAVRVFQVEFGFIDDPAGWVQFDPDSKTEIGAFLVSRKRWCLCFCYWTSQRTDIFEKVLCFAAKQNPYECSVNLHFLELKNEKIYARWGNVLSNVIHGLINISECFGNFRSFIRSFSTSNKHNHKRENHWTILSSYNIQGIRSR